LVLLAEADPGRSYRVSGIYERDRDLLEFLEARGIRPGAKISLIERNYDKTLSIRTGAKTMVLGRPAAEKVWLVPVPSASQ
jgi:Fe2+ transport system protein FeoA